MQLTKLLTLSQFIDQCEGDFAQCYLSINKYNNFLKQPLTKEMFVGDDAIFEGYEHIHNKRFKVQGYTIFNYGYFEPKTLYDLAEATKGTLTLKNVEI